MIPIRLQILVFAILVLSIAGKGEETPPPATPGEAAPAQEKEPDFKKESARADYLKAKVLFDEGKYKEAEALFKKARADAKTKEDKDLLEEWVQGSNGIQVLEKLKPALKTGKRMAALEQAEAYAKKYKGTRADGHYRKFLNELDVQVFVLVQGFDVVTKDYSEKYGKTFIEDPKLVYDGTHALRWTSTEDKKPGALKIENVPKDWSAFDAIAFHLNVTTPPAGLEAVIFSDAKGAAKKGQKAKLADPSDFYRMPVKFTGAAGQWQRVILPLADFTPEGKPSLEYVSHFQLQIPRGKDFDFLIDKVVLVRKEPDAEGTTGAKKKGKKK